ncbi:MAG: diaminopimelate epimerase [Clostridia bacterium]|jgi:diaminopimelate epimerase
MKFTKMHGASNDYVYVNCIGYSINDPAKTAIAISDRHMGIGSDGLIMILPSDKADFRMKMFNADGSEGSMCGNGIRCVGKYVYDNRLTDKKNLDIETKSGIKHLKLFVNKDLVSDVEVDMGEAYIKPEEIPMIAKGDSFINRPLKVGRNEYDVTCLSVGNPHCVVFMNNEKNMKNLKKDLGDLDLDKLGPAFESHKLFPDKINTEFVEVIDRNTLKMRVYERGSKETMACGTGTCAVAVAAVLNGICVKGETVRVIVRGGVIEITYREDGHILMKGNAVKVFDGEIDI